VSRPTIYLAKQIAHLALNNNHSLYSTIVVVHFPCGGMRFTYLFNQNVKQCQKAILHFVMLFQEICNLPFVTKRTKQDSTDVLCIHVPIFLFFILFKRYYLNIFKT
jgi:hypothetical protein